MTPTLDSEQHRRISRRGLLQTTAGATALSLAGVAAGEPADEPTRVEDWHDLAAVREKPYGDYRLVADLDADTDGYDEHVDTDSGWQPVGTPGPDARWLSRTTPFTGRFDGNGHTIRDLRVDRQDTDNVGLFGRVGVTATVERLELVDAAVVGDGRVGALAGSLRGELRLCAVDATVAGGYRVGGLVGQVEDGTVRACRATGAVSGGGSMAVTVGGLVGWLQAGTVSDSFEAMRVDNASGRVVGADGTDLDKSEVVRLEDVYWDESTSESVRTTGITDPDRAAVELRGDVESLVAGETRGASARNSMSGLDFENTWTTVPGEYPQLQVLAPEADDAVPTEIDDWGDLAAVSQDLSGEYELVADLGPDTAGYDEYVGTESGWDPIGDRDWAFTGRLDGNGHTVRGLRVDRPDTDDIGLFGAVGDGGVVERLALTDATLTGSTEVGGLAGVLRGDVQQCAVDADVLGRFSAGGLAGKVDGGTVSACRVTGTVDADDSMGITVSGLTGWLRTGTIERSLVAVSIEAYQVGSIVGVVGEREMVEPSQIESVYWDAGATGISDPVGEQFGQSISDDAGGDDSERYADPMANGSTQTDVLQLRGDVEGVSRAQIQGASARESMADLDFAETWTTVPGSYPQLRVLTDES